jgi:hypothetical protein
MFATIRGLFYQKMRPEAWPFKQGFFQIERSQKKIKALFFFDKIKKEHLTFILNTL